MLATNANQRIVLPHGRAAPIIKCDAVYRRTESMAKSREVNSFECIHCGETLEHWNSAWVPTYRLIVGPVKTIG
jgi:hypothetical protein